MTPQISIHEAAHRLHKSDEETFTLLKNGAFAGDTLHGTVGCLNDDAAAGDDGAVVTADRVEIDKAVFVDVGEDETEFVHVAGEHEDGVAFGIEGGEAVAEGVAGVGVGGGFDVPVEDGLGLGLVTGGRAGVEEFGEENGDLVGRHGF